MILERPIDTVKARSVRFALTFSSTIGPTEPVTSNSICTTTSDKAPLLDCWDEEDALPDGSSVTNVTSDNTNICTSETEPLVIMNCEVSPLFVSVHTEDRTYFIVGPSEANLSITPSSCKMIQIEDEEKEHRDTLFDAFHNYYTHYGSRLADRFKVLPSYAQGLKDQNYSELSVYYVDTPMMNLNTILRSGLHNECTVGMRLALARQWYDMWKNDNSKRFLPSHFLVDPTFKLVYIGPKKRLWYNRLFNPREPTVVPFEEDVNEQDFLATYFLILINSEPSNQFKDKQYPKDSNYIYKGLDGVSIKIEESWYDLIPDTFQSQNWFPGQTKSFINIDLLYDVHRNRLSSWKTYLAHHVETYFIYTEFDLKEHGRRWTSAMMNYELRGNATSTSIHDRLGQSSYSSYNVR